MKIKATSDNVIISVKKKIKSLDELLIDTGEDEPILIGKIIATGPYVDKEITPSENQVCAYKTRVAILPWQTDDENFYVVKEENIYGILEK